MSSKKSSKWCDECNIERPMRFFPLKYSSPDNKGDTCFSCLKALDEYSNVLVRVKQIERTKLFVVKH